MRRKICTLLFCIFSAIVLHAQITGGNNVYEFLNLSPSARVTGLGGNLITIRDDDINLAYANPALLNESMHQQISFNHNIHLAGIGHGYVAYGHHVDKLATTFHAGMQYLTYGDFDATDEFGTINGQFTASEYALTLGAAREVYEKLHVGANLKLISSQLESYNSYGLAVDLGAHYRDTSGRFTATLLIKNAGTQLKAYREGNREPLPFEMQAGISQRLKHLPFRVSIIYHNLQRWNILYDDPNTEENNFLIGGDPSAEDSAFKTNVDNFFRHFVFNGEFLFGRMENFRVRFGYRHLQQKEMKVRNFRSLAGFAFGLGFKINRFRIDYGHQFYHLAGGTNHFTISTNIREFKK